MTRLCIHRELTNLDGAACLIDRISLQPEPRCGKVRRLDLDIPGQLAGDRRWSCWLSKRVSRPDGTAALEGAAGVQAPEICTPRLIALGRGRVAVHKEKELRQVSPHTP